MQGAAPSEPFVLVGARVAQVLSLQLFHPSAQLSGPSLSVAVLWYHSQAAPQLQAESQCRVPGAVLCSPSSLGFCSIAPWLGAPWLGARAFARPHAPELRLVEG